MFNKSFRVMATEEVKQVVVSAKVGAKNTAEEIAEAIEVAKKRTTYKGIVGNGIRFLIKKGVIFLI